MSQSKLNLKYQNRYKSSSSKKFIKKFKGFGYWLLKNTKYLIFILLIVALSLYMVLNHNLHDLFKLTNIEVTGTKTFVNKDDLIFYINDYTSNKNIFSLDISEFSEDISKSFQGIKEVDIVKVFPNKLKVNISERIPLAVVRDSEFDNYYLIDNDGYVLGIVDETKTNLPKLNYKGKIQVGKFLEDELTPFYLELLKNLEELNIEPKNITVENRTLSFEVDGIEIFLDITKDPKKSSKILKTFLDNLKFEERKIVKIDLRYDKVIVEYDNKELPQEESLEE